jgi:4-hydroxybenzoate polyprenyltransferase
MKEECERQRDLQQMAICVDLDGTLVNTDTLIETIILGLQDWRFLFCMPIWLLRGKANFKEKVSQKKLPDPKLLPYNLTVLNYLKKEKENGRKLYLVTAANRKLAESVKEHLGLFDDFIASDASFNLRGRAKAEKLTSRFGDRNFVYLGNDYTDLHVWRSAYGGILVNTSNGLSRRAAKEINIVKKISDKQTSKSAFLKVLRVQQWVKNLLIFIPIITSGNLFNQAAWYKGLNAFLAFCAVASSIYIINDILDLEADRLHPTKRHRPFASGAVDIKIGMVLFPVLLLLGLSLAKLSGILLMSVIYATVSIFYSFKLKMLPLVDLFTLASLYTIRLFAGGRATGYEVSLWLLAFSFFLFFGLANIKRVGELRMLQKTNKKNTIRRGYKTDDTIILQMMGIASCFISCLVLALYVQSHAVIELYAHPKLLWILIPVILFWQCHMWLSTSRGQMRDDPIVYAAKDWISWSVVFSVIAIMVLANFTL